MRNYKKKAVIAQWSDEQMTLAIKTVKEDGQSVIGTAKKFNIPRTTLQNKLYDYEAQKKGQYKKGTNKYFIIFFKLYN